MYDSQRKPLSILDRTFHEAQLQINQMPNETLAKLRDNPSDLSQFIQTLPTMQIFANKRRQLIEQNRHLAMNNLLKESELIDARKQLSQSLAKLAPLRDEYFKSQAAKADILPSPDLVLAQLQSALHASERSEDDMIETFFYTSHDDHDIDVFVKRFLNHRLETIELRCIAEAFCHLYEIEKRKK